MRTKKATPVICPFGECQLPKDNPLLVHQFLYLFFSHIVMFYERDSLNGTSVLMLILPILFDIVLVKPRRYIMRYIRMVYLILAMSIFAFALLMVSGFFIEEGATIITSPRALFPKVEISKTLVVIILETFLPIPLVILFGQKTQNQGKGLRMIRAIEEFESKID